MIDASSFPAVDATLWTLGAFSVATWGLTGIKAVQHARVKRGNWRYAKAFGGSPNSSSAAEIKDIEAHLHVGWPGEFEDPARLRARGVRVFRSQNGVILVRRCRSSASWGSCRGAHRRSRRGRSGRPRRCEIHGGPLAPGRRIRNRSARSGAAGVLMRRLRVPPGPMHLPGRLAPREPGRLQRRPREEREVQGGRCRRISARHVAACGDAGQMSSGQQIDRSCLGAKIR